MEIIDLYGVLKKGNMIEFNEQTTDFKGFESLSEEQLKELDKPRYVDKDGKLLIVYDDWA